MWAVQTLDTPAHEFKIVFGGREGIRTPGLLVANEALSQLSYSPTSSNQISANAAHLAKTPPLDCKQEGAPGLGRGAPKTTIATATDSTVGCLRHLSAAP